MPVMHVCECALRMCNCAAGVARRSVAAGVVAAVGECACGVRAGERVGAAVVGRVLARRIVNCA